MTDPQPVVRAGEWGLSPEDVAALKAMNGDLSDLDEATLTRAHQGFRHAYEVAERIMNGTLDPLSA